MPETHEKPRVGQGEDDEGPLLPPILRGGMDDIPGHAGGLPGYAELHCISNFSFQRGADRKSVV